MAEKAYTDGRLLVGNCLETLKTLEDNSIDSIVTDPPYELGFMGKTWDNSGVAYQVSLWQECLRVLKPGGHLLAFGGTRTYHRMSVAIEDAGFEIRDSIHWTYGSGFPKSLDISKAIDKAAGHKPIETGEPNNLNACLGGSACKCKTDGIKYASTKHPAKTKPSTKEAKQWQGWGTALKPSHEPIVLARKPLIGTVAENVLQHSTGAINIDGTRIGTTDKWEATGKQSAPSNTLAGGKDGSLNVSVSSTHIQGRFPANTLLTHNHDCQDTCTPNCPVTMFPNTTTGGGNKNSKTSKAFFGNMESNSDYDSNYSIDSGSAARFFHNSQWQPADDITPFIYQAKAGKKERNAGLDRLDSKSVGAKGNGLARVCSQCNTPQLQKCECKNPTFINPERQNFHPTVKPIELMRYLIKLITPPKGTVLDPFLGSGTTAVAAILEGFDWKGCEMTEDYLPIIKARVNWALKEKKKEQPKLI